MKKTNKRNYYFSPNILKTSVFKQGMKATLRDFALKPRALARGSFILLIVLLCFHLTGNLLLLKENPLPEGKDSYAHTSAFINLLQTARSGTENPLYITGRGLIYNFIFISSDYPPLFYLTAYLLKFLLSLIYINGALFTSSLFLIILLFSVYRIGSHRNKDTGVLAAFICGFYPIIHQSSRHFNLELATAAMVTLTVWMLVETNLFTNLFFSVCLGVSLGLGMLTKQTFIVFITAPCLFYAGYSLCRLDNKNPEDRSKIKNMVLAVSIGIVLSAVFYWNNLVYKSIASRAGFTGAVADKNLLSLKHLLYYPFSLLETIGVFFVLVFFFGLINLRKAGYLYMYLLITWLIFPIVFLTFFSLKYAEYTISLLPALALISAAGIFAIPGERLRKSMVIMIFVFSLVFYFQTNYGFSRSFYSSWDIDKQYRLMAIKQGENVNKDKSQVQDVIEQIGNSDINIGICYDNMDIFFPTFLVKRVFSSTTMNASIIDFSKNMTAFFKNINDFELLIYITHSKKQWLTKKSFDQFIADLNESRNIKVVFSDQLADDHVYADRKLISIADNLAQKLVHIKKGYDPYCYMRFLNESVKTYEHVYMYRRQN